MIGFPGPYEDAETGLHQNWFRDYQAGLGRYIESDPLGVAGGPNPYSYGAGNPAAAVDREGLKVCKCQRRFDSWLGFLTFGLGPFHGGVAFFL